MEKPGRHFPTGSQNLGWLWASLSSNRFWANQLMWWPGRTETQKGRSWGDQKGAWDVCMTMGWNPESPWEDRERIRSTTASTRLLWPLHGQTLNTRYAAVGILVITHLGTSFLLRHTSLGTYCSPHPDTARTPLARESTSPAQSFFFPPAIHTFCFGFPILSICVFCLPSGCMVWLGLEL